VVSVCVAAVVVAAAAEEEEERRRRRRRRHALRKSSGSISGCGLKLLVYEVLSYQRMRS
jgi:hypothetical protein